MTRQPLPFEADLLKFTESKGVDLDTETLEHAVIIYARDSLPAKVCSLLLREPTAGYYRRLFFHAVEALLNR